MSLIKPEGAGKRAVWLLGIYFLGAELAVLAFMLRGFLTLRTVCIFRLLTGLYCPGCGGSRMLLYLLKGSFAEAAHSNCFLFFSLPLIAIELIWQSIYYIRYGDLTKGFGRVLVIYMVFMFVFWFLRNVPGLGFLAP